MGKEICTNVRLYLISPIAQLAFSFSRWEKVARRAG